MKRSIIVCALFLFFVSLDTSCPAQVITPGNMASNGLIEINYNPDGTWNRSSDAGVQGIKYTGVDFSAPGTPWQQVTIGFNGQEIKGNFSTGVWEWATPAGVDIYSGSCFGSIVTWFVKGKNGEHFVVVKQEKMCKGSSVVKMKFCVTNIGEVPLERFSLTHGVDPDQDIAGFGLYTTQNDVVSNGHLATALGVNSGLTIGYGLCDSVRQQVGFTNWDTAAAPQLYDPNGAYQDITVHCITRYDVILPYQSRAFKFYVLFDTKESAITIEELYRSAVKACCCCDLSKRIELPDGPGGGGHGDPDAIVDDKDAATRELLRERILRGEDVSDMKESFHLLASPFNLEAEDKGGRE